MRTIAALVAVVVTACGPAHVALPPPTPALSPDQRVAYFMAMRPVKEAYVAESTDGGDSWRITDRTLILANKLHVQAPEDLVSVVGTETATARAASASVTARHRANQAWVAVMLSVAAAIWIVGPPGHDPPFGLGTTPAWVIGATPIVISSLVEWHYGRVELGERARTFSLYTRDLGDRLNLCASGTQVVPCEEGEPRAPATSQPGRTASLEMR